MMIVCYTLTLSFFATILFILLYSIYRKNIKYLLLILFCIVILYPQNKIISYKQEGYVQEIKDKYVIINNNHNSFIAYNINDVNYNDYIIVIGQATKIKNNQTFYNFNYAEYCAKNNIYFQVYADHYKLVRHKFDLRNIVREKIKKSSNFFLYDFMFFNINHYDKNNIINKLGLVIIGFIYLINKFLSYLFYEKTTKIITGLLIIFISIYLHFPYACIRLLISYFLSCIKINKYNKAGLYGILLLLYNPYKVTDIGFIIPFGFKLINCIGKKQKTIIQYFFLTVVQTIYFNYLNILVLLLFKYLKNLLGFLCLICLINFFTFDVNLNLFNSILKLLSNYQNILVIKGNPLGFGLVLYIIIIFKYHHSWQMYILYILFLSSGLFHPITTLTICNIHQGDSIIFHDFFNNTNIIFDTGPENGYANLKNYLNGKSINTVDALFISHYDLDHCANINSLFKDFTINELIDQRKKTYEINNQCFYNLNWLKTTDKNEQSQVILFNYHNLNILLTGDAPISVENDIIKKYPKIHIDLLKVGHHGSNTSSSKKFINYLQPKLALCSAGVNNYYHHPHLDVVNNFNQAGILMLCTKDEGDITIFFTTFFNFFITSSGKIGII